MWKWLEQYLTFTSGERKTIITLIILCIVVLIIPKVYFFFKPIKHIDSLKYEPKWDTLSNGAYMDEDETDSLPSRIDTQNHFHHTEKASIAYFTFDPNKIGVSEWVKLGFSEKQAQSIEKYKATGAKFYKPEDLMKLYVMTEEHYYKLEPYVKIDVSALPKKRNRKKDDVW